MLRAWQTAELFQQQLTKHSDQNYSIACFDALAERCVGAVANLSVEQIEHIIASDPRYQTLPANWKSDSYFQLPFQGAESLMQAGERLAKHLIGAMQSLTPTETDQVKFFVGHGASFRHAAFQLGILQFEQIAQFSMFYAQPLLFEYHQDGSWSHIAGDWKLRKPKQEAID
jgi:2,3-bisphosphoglycerate-dependent phosphoglycerate mutase